MSHYLSSSPCMLYVGILGLHMPLHRFESIVCTLGEEAGQEPSLGDDQLGWTSGLAAKEDDLRVKLHHYIIALALRWC